MKKAPSIKWLGAFIFSIFDFIAFDESCFFVNFSWLTQLVFSLHFSSSSVPNILKRLIKIINFYPGYPLDLGHHFSLVKDQSNISFLKFFDRPQEEYNIGMGVPGGRAF